MIKMHPQIRTRRDVIFGAAGLAAFSIVRPRFAAAQDNPTAPSRDYVEHRIARGEHKLYAREWEGKGPALVLLHGFPDNLHIYDELAPLLARAGRRVVSFDFLGFGASDKPEGFAYNFKQHVDDLAVVADALKLETFIQVAHDAGGPAAINYALDHRKRVAAMVLLNSFYADAPTLKFPELIELFSDPDLKDLGLAFLGDRSKLEWLLTFQNHHFVAKASPELRAQDSKVRGQMRFKRSAGQTASEQVLAELCDKSFLKLWTYPNLFRKPGKELADLLVSCASSIIT